MKAIRIGDKYQVYGDSLQAYDSIPPYTYNVRFDEMTGFYLKARSKLTVNEKIYGVHPEKAEKVLKSFSMDCSSPISINILWKIPNLLLSSTGTGSPHWNMYWRSPAVCRQTDFPPALGPDIRMIRWSSLISRLSGTTSFPFALKFR